MIFKVDLKLCVDLKVVDFMSKFRHEGTPYYLPPEAIVNAAYGPWTDIWSLGITAIEMFNGDVPFSNPFKSMFKSCTNTIGNVSLLLKHPEKCSRNFISFIDSCLTFDHHLRPTATDLLNVIPFSNFIICIVKINYLLLQFILLFFLIVLTNQ